MVTIDNEQFMLQSLENERYEAVLHCDLDIFRGLCHPDLVYGHTTGNRDSLETYIGKLRIGDLRYHWIDHKLENIVVIGDTALVIGHMSAKVSVNGQVKTLNNAALAVWTKVAGGWKFIAYQPTPILAGANQDREAAS